MVNIEDLKKKRDQLSARIQQAEARNKITNKKAEDRTKILIGAAVLGFIKNKPSNSKWLLETIADFYKTKEKDLGFLLGESRTGSETLAKLIEPKATKDI